MHKKPPHTKNPYEQPSHTNHRTLTLRMKNHHILTILMKNHYTNNSYEKPLYKHYENKHFCSH